MRHFDLLSVLGLNIGSEIVVEAVLQAVSLFESNYLFAMSDWRKYGIHKGLFLWPFLWITVAWLVFTFEVATGHSLSKFGLFPGSWKNWYGPLTFPWLHGDLNHITSNTISLFFVGILIRYSFPKVFDKVWLVSLLLPGIILWFIGRPSIHIGASAWLYALVSFVFFSGVLRLHVRLLAQSMLMVFLYGSFVWGVLPHDPSISYEGHLSGAIVGFLLAILFRKEEPIEPLKNSQPIAEDDVPWDDWKHPFERELTYEEINPTAGKPLQQPQVRPFRYEDGSSPDELA
ncbi:MAG: hypothetical protein CMP53_04350 [Flavobacteriales bacterium]|nr:hypothetical protein [Flavobacteriales bacterium]